MTSAPVTWETGVLGGAGDPGKMRGAEGEKELPLTQPRLPRFRPPPRPLPACRPASLLTPSALLPTTILQGRQARAPGTGAQRSQGLGLLA